MWDSRDHKCEVPVEREDQDQRHCALQETVSNRGSLPLSCRALETQGSGPESSSYHFYTLFLEGPENSTGSVSRVREKNGKVRLSMLSLGNPQSPLPPVSSSTWLQPVQRSTHSTKRKQAHLLSPNRFSNLNSL